MTYRSHAAVMLTHSVSCFKGKKLGRNPLESPPRSRQSTAPSHPRGSAVDHVRVPPAGRVVPCRRQGRHKPLGLGQPVVESAKRPEDQVENTRTKNQNYGNPHKKYRS